MNNFWKIFLAALLGCLVALGLIFFIFMGSLGAALAGGAAKTAVVPPQSILKIDFSTPISERGQSSFSVQNIASMNLSMDEGMPLLTAIRAIDAAAADPGVKFIYLNTDKMGMSMSCTEELRQALARFRESGKPVIAYANGYDNLSYYLASVADKVIINTYGEAMITLFRDQSQDVLTRDFAVQHIGLYAQALERRGEYAPDSADARECRVALFEAAGDTRTIVAAAAFRALADIANFDSRIDASRLNSLLANCAADLSSAPAARAMAVQLCGERRVNAARPALEEICADSSSPEILRLSASRSLAAINGH